MKKFHIQPQTIEYPLSISNLFVKLFLNVITLAEEKC